MDTGRRWVLHVGDCFYHHGQVDGSRSAPKALTVFERLIAYDWNKVQENHRRLRELWLANDPGILLVNAHDPLLLDRARSAGRDSNPDVETRGGVPAATATLRVRHREGQADRLLAKVCREVWSAHGYRIPVFVIN